MTSLALHLVCLLVASAASQPAPAPAPAPGPARVPRVYNALITSNQNLEPSKAYPVYQPVVHDAAFLYPYQTPLFFGGDFPLTNGLVPAATSRNPNKRPATPAPSPDTPEAKPAETPEAPRTPEALEPEEEDKGKKDGALPPQPSTESPIPLNEFGLPPQVLPLGRFDPAFDGFTQVGSLPQFTYSYPGFRFYDPYDPFSFNPYANLPPPLYRPITNVLTPGVALAPPKGPIAPAPAPTPAPEQPADGAAPPSEPSDLNVLNYSSKDPAIPNVPPPPLPSGGLKSDKSE